MYQALLFVDPSTNTRPTELMKALQDFYRQNGIEHPPTISCHDDTVTISWPGFSLRLAYSDDPHVQEEARDIADQFGATYSSAARLRQARARFELEGDPDPEMQFFNDYLFAIEVAQRVCQVYPFDPQSCTFVDEP